MGYCSYHPYIEERPVKTSILVAMFVLGTLAMPVRADNHETATDTTTTTEATTTKTKGKKMAAHKKAKHEKKHAKKKAMKAAPAPTNTEAAPEMQAAPTEGATDEAGM
jgi:hypothetical protein